MGASEKHDAAWHGTEGGEEFARRLDDEYAGLHETSITWGVDYDGAWGSWTCTCGAERLHMGGFADASHSASHHRQEATR